VWEFRWFNAYVKECFEGYVLAVVPGEAVPDVAGGGGVSELNPRSKPLQSPPKVPAILFQ